MATTFKPRSAEAYEQSMGRWSRRLAGPFIAFSGIADGERVLDVGCGTGSLTFALSQAANLARIAAVDYSENFVEAARQKNNDPRITIELADACALPFADASFDRALSLLVLQFIPEADRAVTEMCRVVRPGGVVAAAVWDSFGGRTTDRMFWDTAAIVEPALAVHRAEHYFRPMTRPNEMKTFWTRLGLKDVEETSLLIRMEYASFEDYWGPIGAGETTFGKFVVDLSGPVRRQLELSLRAAYEGGQPDGPRSFAAVALACRGIVP
jgi:SAM-dependent methyltransferase